MLDNDSSRLRQPFFTRRHLWFNNSLVAVLVRDSKPGQVFFPPVQIPNRPVSKDERLFCNQMCFSGPKKKTVWIKNIFFPLQQAEAPSPSDCSVDSTSGLGIGGIGSVGSSSVSSGIGGLVSAGSSSQAGVAAGVCAACGELITDRFLIQVSGRTWHSTCLRCSVCRTALDNQPSCFVRAGAIYCRADYTRYEVLLKHFCQKWKSSSSDLAINDFLKKKKQKSKTVIASGISTLMGHLNISGVYPNSIYAVVEFVMPLGERKTSGIEKLTPWLVNGPRQG